MKLFDERVLGGATFVTVTLGAKGRVKWEKTESYIAGDVCHDVPGHSDDSGGTRRGPA